MVTDMAAVATLWRRQEERTAVTYSPCCVSGLGAWHALLLVVGIEVDLMHSWSGA